MSNKEKSAAHPMKLYKNPTSQNIRLDRNLDEFRPAQVNLGYISTCDGSALVSLGETKVICGIKAELCQPKTETPNQGFLIPNVELPPLCSPKFRPGPPSELAQIYTQTIANIVANSGFINLKDLCLHKDRLAWCLYTDLICLNFDGSVIDACVIALTAALKTLTLPVIDYDPALDNKLVNLEERKPIRMKNVPVSTSFAVFEDKVILADPSAEEEDSCSGLITVVTADSELCYVHKPGGTPLKQDELSRLIAIGKKRETLVTALINSAHNNVRSEQSKEE